MDGSSSFWEARLGLLLKSPQGDHVVQSVTCNFKASNNEAEYKALITVMALAQELGATSLEVYSDSLLVFSQMKA